jgi:antitoxin component YwqK of YwqJK toxin-antitoxin module
MKNILIILSVLISTSVWACNFGSTHSVLWHYNQTDIVFVGTVLKVGNVRTMDFSYREKITNIPTYKIRLVVEDSYRGDLSDTIEIGKMALANLRISEGDTYLIYANFSESEGIYTIGSNSVLHVLDPRMSRHSVLKEIDKNPNGKIVEYNQVNGEIWATGNLENGKPVGEWKYYEITGEIKEAGKYDKNGKRHKKWTTYFVTDQRAFMMFEGIAKGRSSQFELVDYKKIEDKNSLYQYEITFFDNLQKKETIAQYLYKTPRAERISKFKHGNYHGKEKFYNDAGEMISFQNWKNNKKHGRYKFIQNQSANGNTLQTVVEGIYRNGEIIEEIIYYFENGKLSGSEVMVLKD